MLFTFILLHVFSISLSCPVISLHVQLWFCALKIRQQKFHINVLPNKWCMDYPQIHSCKQHATWYTYLLFRIYIVENCHIQHHCLVVLCTLEPLRLVGCCRRKRHQFEQGQNRFSCPTVLMCITCCEAFCRARCANII